MESWRLRSRHNYGKVSNDIDYVVVGSNLKEMLNLGFKSVGKDFPVFLHPETKDEYALARCEKRTGPGYSGFGNSSTYNPIRCIAQRK